MVDETELHILTTGMVYRYFSGFGQLFGMILVLLEKEDVQLSFKDLFSLWTIGPALLLRRELHGTEIGLRHIVGNVTYTGVGFVREASALQFG